MRCCWGSANKEGNELDDKQKGAKVTAEQEDVSTYTGNDMSTTTTASTSTATTTAKVETKEDSSHGSRGSIGSSPLLGRKPTEKEKAKLKKTAKDFQEVCQIGQGGYGRVVLCKLREKDEMYAMKILNKESIRESHIQRITAERDIMAYAQHEFMTKLHWSFQTDKHLYFVMEFMQGGDLMKLLIAKDTFSAKDTAFYMGELCLAVHKTHELGFCHRDLKPDNVLLDVDGHVKLADFGVAKKLVGDKRFQDNITHKVTESSEDSDSTSPRSKTSMKEKRKKWRAKQAEAKKAYSLCGTPDYMAPEIFEADGYKEGVDWWSVGCITFECLAGYAPFWTDLEGWKPVINLVRKWRTTFELPDEIRPNSVEADLLHHLICDQKDRYNFADIKKHDFFKGFDWDNARKMKAPFKKDFKDKKDVRAFGKSVKNVGQPVVTPEDDASSSDEEEPQTRQPGIKGQKVQDFTFFPSDTGGKGGDDKKDEDL